jgi:hypothetical protein
VNRFKMETFRSIRESLHPLDFTISIDLEDAYLHVSIHPSCHRFLRFVLGNTVYHFVALPFGLTSAPFVFTKLKRPILGHLQSILCRAYLDDWLLRHSSHEILQHHLQTTLSLLFSLGLGVIYPKSCLLPAQRFVFLVCARVFPTPERVGSIAWSIRSLLAGSSFTVRELSRLIGLLDATASVVLCRLWRVRPLH